MKNKLPSKNSIILIAIACAGIIFSLGFLFGRISSPSSPLSIINKIHSDGASFTPYVQAWQIINDKYIDQPVNQELLIQGSIRGMLDSLGDPYTGYLDPQEYATQNAPLEGEYTGIGAWVDVGGSTLVIISPMPDSPAEEAGLLPGDKVVGIDGENMTDIEPPLVLNRILGPAGTEITIMIEREGESEFLEFTITRAVIPIPSVESEILENDIGYIHIYSFAEKTYDEFSTALSDLLDKGAESLIIDLRYNTGGLVDSAIDVTSLFIEEKIVFIEESGDGNRIEYGTSVDAIALDQPLVILVNEGTASSSEIMAGALQDYDRAALIGGNTFGKGLIQNWIPLDGDNGAVRVTIAKWLTPAGRQIQDLGLEPDEIVDYTQEDFDMGVDPQLDKAIESLNELK